MGAFWSKLGRALWAVVRRPEVREVVLGWVADKLAQERAKAAASEKKEK